jgi:hypothetical protein
VLSRASLMDEDSEKLLMPTDFVVMRGDEEYETDEK